MAHHFRPKRHRYFFAYEKIPKICKLQDAQKHRPRAEFGILQDGSFNFHGWIRFWAFQLAILAGKAIFSTFVVAPPILSDLKFSSGAGIFEHLEICIFLTFLHRQKKLLTLGSEIMCHVTLGVIQQPRVDKMRGVVKCPQCPMRHR